MLNQVQNIRSFVDRRLGDLTRWNDVEVSPDSNGDRGAATVKVGTGRYRIAVTSAYIAPPLGKVAMTNLDTKESIEGDKADETWAAIERHIRGQKPLKRADSAPELALPARKQAEPSDGRAPYLSQPVKFICERGEAIGGMLELAAFVTEVVSPTVVSLTIMPKTGELFWRNDLPRRTADRQFNCWDFAGESQDAELLARVEALEAKRGPGRSPNSDKAKAE